jgi:hypothetical protein
MAHYAKVENGIVTQVIVAEQDFINSGYVGEPTDWVQTSYNTHGNQHPEGRPLRGNYAGIGYTYDATNDVFYAPTPFPSWILNNTTWLWEAPIAYPADGVVYPAEGKVYKWNESITNWEEVTL